MFPSEATSSLAVRARRRRTRGVTLVEMMISVLVLSVSILGTLATIVSAETLQRRTAAQHGVDRAAFDALEQIRNGDPTDTLDQYRKQPTFTQEGLTITVTFPRSLLDRTLPDLKTSTTCFSDTDQDGQIDLNSSNATAPGLLPVEVTASNGTNRVVLQTMVLRR
jgi:Tfp pilus assembly protein PilV